MRHLIPISGKDSCATAIVQTTRFPRDDYEFFFNDVRTELPETYAWLARVEEEKGWRIQRIGADLEEVIRGFGGFLPSPKNRYCTRLTKIEPLEAWVGDDPVTVYYGLRNDEARVGYRPGKKANIVPAYPLVADAPWPGLDIKGVWALLQAHDLLPPAFEWPALRERVMDLVTEEDLAPLHPWERHVLFSGRTRANCFMCFYQRQYEYVWLYDEHPDLFERACAMEEASGDPDYTWRQGYRLRDLPARREEVIGRRAREVAQIVHAKKQGDLFGDSGDNLIAVTSCGLLCGK